MIGRKPSERFNQAYIDDFYKSNSTLKNNLVVFNEDDQKYRCVSYESEIPFDRYFRIDNSEKTPEETAVLIKETFKL